MSIGFDKLVQYLDSIYAYVIKPTIEFIFEVYYKRAIKSKIEHANQDILFYSASFLAKQIQNKQVRNNSNLIKF